MYICNMEIWKSITGYEGRYEISSKGSVKSLPKKKGKGVGYLTKPKTLIGKIDKYGYLTHGLRDVNGKRKFFTVHRLMAIEFIDNPEDKPTVDHLDRVKLNNELSNLRWATVREQNQNRNVATGSRNGMNTIRGRKNYDIAMAKISR